MKITYQRPPLTPYQIAILDSPARYTVTAASTKAGKTASHIVWLFEQAIQGKKGQSFWWVAPVYGQAEIAFRRFKQQCSQKLFEANESKLRLTLPSGAMIEFKSAEKPDNLYGDDVYAAVFDEFTRAREEAWFALRSTLTKTRGKCKLIGNVKGKKNWGYRLAERARQGEDNYEFHKITAWDAVAAGILEREEVEQAERDLPAHVFRELYLAEPADDDSNPFGLDHIRSCIEPLADGPVEWFGIDLAKSRDWTVIVGLNKDKKVCLFERFRLDWKATRDSVQRIVGRTPAVIDSTGVGDPIVEDLQRVCPRIQGFKYTAISKQQIMEDLAAAIHGREVVFPDGPIVDELMNFEWTHRRTGVSYNAPEGLHDDCVNALALALHCSRVNKKGLFLLT
jgi:phage FluMu gp28-like protein